MKCSFISRRLAPLVFSLVAMWFVTGCAPRPFAVTGKKSKIHVGLRAKAPADVTFDIHVGRITAVAGGQDPAVYFNGTMVSGAPAQVTVKKGASGADFTIQPADKLCDETLVFLLSEQGSVEVAGVGTVPVIAPEGKACQHPPKAAAAAALQMHSHGRGHGHRKGVSTPISVGRK
jgi:hypothetical protein